VGDADPTTGRGTLVKGTITPLIVEVI